MRMWMVSPNCMCDRHLLGEHAETHMIAAFIGMKKNVTGFLDKRLIEPGSVKARHDELALEMTRRGFNHHSDLDGALDLSYLGQGANVKVDRRDSIRELSERCPECRKRISEMKVK